METDADRLNAIKGLGGRLLSVRGQQFWAIFNNASLEALDLVESSEPYLEMRESDWTGLTLRKEDVIDGLPSQMKVKQAIHDGMGMTRVLLK